MSFGTSMIYIFSSLADAAIPCSFAQDCVDCEVDVVLKQAGTGTVHNEDKPNDDQLQSSNMCLHVGVKLAKSPFNDTLLFKYVPAGDPL